MIIKSRKQLIRKKKRLTKQIKKLARRLKKMSSKRRSQRKRTRRKKRQIKNIYKKLYSSYRGGRRETEVDVTGRLGSALRSTSSNRYNGDNLDSPRNGCISSNTPSQLTLQERSGNNPLIGGNYCSKQKSAIYDRLELI